MTVPKYHHKNKDTKMEFERVYRLLPDVKIGSFTCPGATGNYSVTGIGFKPRIVKFHVARVSAVTFDMSVGVMDYNGNQWSYGFTGLDDNQRSTLSLTRCIYLIYPTDGVLTVAAAYVSMNDDGFTIDILVASANYTIMWEAWG